MAVDSFKYLPRIVATYYRMTDQQVELPIPWTPTPAPLPDCRFGLVTSGGLYHRTVEPPFDVVREKQEPTWGDPTYRIIPADIRQAEVGASHLHINTHSVLSDVNILLPIHRFRELAREGYIGGLAKQAYSFMGYQGFPRDTTAWRETFGPQVAERFKAEGVDCVLLIPA
jgi:D-proline reductase (dithiol) PrdB